MGFFGTKEPRVPPHPRREPTLDLPVSAASVRKLFGKDADFSSRTVLLAGSRPVTAFFFDGLTEGGKITETVLWPLTRLWAAGAQEKEPGRAAAEGRAPPPETDREAAEALASGGLYTTAADLRETMDEAAADLLAGRCALFFRTDGFCVTVAARTENRRSISEPEVESSVKGAKDSFTEELRVCTSLVRRRLKSPFLRVAEEIVGRQSRTAVDILWIDGLTAPALVESVRKRLAAIDTDGVFYTGNVEEYLIDRPWSSFPQVITTQRPDKFCAHLLEGRVGVLIEGMPIAYAAPGTLESFLRAPQDSSDNYLLATILTVLRYAAMILTLFLPAFYIAVAGFHPEMIPARLMAAVIESKQDVPFTTAVEVLAMLTAFEILQEAGLRLPKAIGQSVSIIGGLVVGQSAVEARIISPIVVIVVAATGVMGYTIPNQDFAGALRIWRFALAAAASFLGLLGMVLAFAVLLGRLSALESFGVPYLTPFAAARGPAESPLLRPPLMERKERDAALHPQNVRKQR
ncbi:MAG TPA: spore germination protein [Oscillospiraceae bacterium]|nr:spore germination protein [Oscillospiraceae bacterium]